MKRLLILGAGTAGTIMLNKLRKHLDPVEWEIAIVDGDRTHYYQPGFLFIPFGIYERDDVVRDKADFFPPGTRAIFAPVERIEPERNRVLLSTGEPISYDFLIIATGAAIDPGETEGMQGPLWREKIFDFYTLDGALALREALRDWPGGNLVVHITEMPIKCPVAPMEFAFLADDYFKRAGIRDKVQIHYVTPLPGAFTKPVCSDVLGHLIAEKGIKLVTEFNISHVDNEAGKIVSYDDQEVPFDLLVTVPTNKGAKAIGSSGMGDDLDFVETDRHTLQAKGHHNIFVIGDATNVPASKAGSVAHFESDVLERNILDAIAGRAPSASFDGHANCFIESGDSKAILIDFNYDLEPVSGKFPLPVLGPFSLLKETRINHLGKLFFKWMYWHLLLTGRELPIGSGMSLMGKDIPADILAELPAK